MHTPTHSNVLEYLNVKVTSPMEEKTEAYISRYVRSLDRDSLSLFVQFYTSSSTIEPGSSIKVVFENQDDRNFVIRAAACFKIFYCPKNCSCYKQFKTACYVYCTAQLCGLWTTRKMNLLMNNQIISITTTNKYQQLNGDLQKQWKKFPCTLNVFKRHDCAGEFSHCFLGCHIIVDIVFYILFVLWRY